MRRLLQPLFATAVLLMASVLSVTLYAIGQAEQRVERAVAQNFSAAGLLARMQVEGERMRRYEKEMFIYAAVPASRAKYVKEYDDAHRRLLALANDAAAPSGRSFNDEDRKQMLRWSEATSIYSGEFTRIAASADQLNVDQLTPEQKLALTTRFNSEIKDGKDRFAELLKGTATMREAKEKQSLAIGDEIKGVFRSLGYTMLGISVAVVALMAWWVLRREQPGSTGGGHGHATGLGPRQALR
jgi:hypothetical protein